MILEATFESNCAKPPLQYAELRSYMSKKGPMQI